MAFFRPVYILIFGTFSFLVLVGAGALTLQQLNLLQQNTEIVRKNYNSLLNLESLHSHFKDVETGARGFVITKDSSFLKPYFSGKNSIYNEIIPVLASERDLMGSDSNYVATLDSLKQAMDQRLAAATRLVELAATRPGIDASQLALVASGKNNMDLSRKYVNSIRNYRQGMLDRQTQRLREYTRNIPLYVWSLSGVAMSILAILFFALTEQLRVLRAYRHSLEARFAELRTAYENLGRYNILANHHLKEPVRKMLLFLDRYQSRYQTVMPDQEREMVKKMEELSRQAFRLLEGLSMYSDLDVQEPGAAVKSIDLKELVKDIVGKNERQIQQVGAIVDVAGDLPVVTGKPDQLRYVFQQLLDNALKFSQTDVPVRISISGEKGPVDKTTEKPLLARGVRQVYRIHVSDNGRGIAGEHQERIFQLFYQLNAEDSAESAGVGLALCQKIARQHGGFITLKSEENMGSVFTIVLPAKN